MAFTRVAIALGVVSIAAASRPTLAWEASTTASGSIELRDAGKAAASFVPKTPREQRGRPAVRQVSVAGHRVLEVRLPVTHDGPRREEVWVAELPSRRVIWWDVAGALDVDGETARALTVSESGIEEYQTVARLYRCDGAPVKLFRRVWDFEARRFRPQAPALPPAAATVVQARRGDPAMPGSRPLGGFHFTAASSSAGARDAREVVAPVAVGDGRPETAWAAGGDGRGDWLSARSGAGFAITGLRILPGDAASARAYRASGRPRRLTVLFDGDPGQNVDVELLEDADGGARRFREPFWIALPRPVSSGCVSVLIRDVSRGRTPVAVSALEVVSEVDGPAGLDRLVADLAAARACETRQQLLAQTGPAALGKLVEVLARTPAGAGRECLVRALHGLLPRPQAGPTPDLEGPAGLAAALAGALPGATADEERIVLSTLPRLREPPLAELAALLGDGRRPDVDRERAARALAGLGSCEGISPVLALLGGGSRELRARLRQIAAGAPATSAPAVLAALAGTPAAKAQRRADLLLVLGAAAKRQPEHKAAALAALRAALDAQDFEQQARAIAGLGLVRDPAALAELHALRGRSGDGTVRALAVREIAAAGHPATIPALRAALDDTDPRVRETAALGLGRLRDKASAQAIIAGARQEPWPQVRRAEIAALGDLCTAEGNDLMLRAYERDVLEVRMAALESFARCREPRAAALLVRVLGRLPEPADLRSLAARLLGELKDRRAIRRMAEVLVRLRSESEADLALEGTATETVLALAAMGGPEAVTAAVGLLADRRPSLKRAAIDALAMLCDPGPGAAALREAAHSKDEAVSMPALAAQQRCREKAAP